MFLVLHFLTAGKLKTCGQNYLRSKSESPESESNLRSKNLTTHLKILNFYLTLLLTFLLIEFVF